MKNSKMLKSSSKNETDLKKFINFNENNLVNRKSSINVPFRSQFNILPNHLQQISIKNEVECGSTMKYIENCHEIDSNDFLICPTISYFKPANNIEKLQENNNFYVNSSRNQSSHSVGFSKSNSLRKKYEDTHFDTQNEEKPDILLPQWNQSISCSMMKTNFKGKISDGKNCKDERNNKMFLAPQFFKAEAILNNNFQKHLVSSSNMDNKLTCIPICKPPLSISTTPSSRNQKLATSKRDESFFNRVDDTLTEKDMTIYDNSEIHSETPSNNNGEFSIKDNEDEEESDFDDKAEEMDLLDNLDSEIINDDMEEVIQIDTITERDCESPTEEMLEEVHRLFQATSVNDIKPAFIYSIFPNVPPVIRFVREGESLSVLPLQYKSKLKWKLSSLTPNVVKRAAKRSGFKLINKGSQWIGYFGSHLKLTGFTSILEYQKFNHLPGSFQIGRKDKLWRNVSNLASKNRKFREFNFLPKTYCLPGDMKSLKLAWDAEDSIKKAKWILKPPASARGIGVKVINKWSQIPKKKPTIVQKYISRPFLIDGSKFDLRIYVAVTSCDPLRIYVHKNGLVRFASHKYSKSSKDISNRFIHLTNYSVNKRNENYTNNENHEKCQGHKWTLQTLWKHMEENLQIEWKPIWKKIKDCIVKTIISVESNINSNIRLYCAQKNSVYELFGFDVLLDSKLKPWVIEVNVSPSLHSNSPLDIEVKSSMVADLFNLVGFQLFQNTEESTPLLSSQSRQPSLSASSIPKKYIKLNQRQSSLISLSKSSSRKVSTGRSTSKRIEKVDNITAKLTQKTQSNDSLSNCQFGNFLPSSKQVTQYNIFKRKKTSISSSSTLGNLSPSVQEIIDPSLYQRHGYFNRTLNPNEKSKHMFYIQKDVYEDKSILSTITDRITIDDARILIESLDEFNRAGDFEISFPTSAEETDDYISYINNNSGCRYYNILLHQFIKKFQAKNNCKVTDDEGIYKIIRPEGIKVLEAYCKDLLGNENVDLWINPRLKDFSKNQTKLRSSSAGNI